MEDHVGKWVMRKRSSSRASSVRGMSFSSVAPSVRSWASHRYKALVQALVPEIASLRVIILPGRLIRESNGRALDLRACSMVSQMDLTFRKGAFRRRCALSMKRPKNFLNVEGASRTYC